MVKLKDKITRYKLMDIHQDLIRGGKYEEAYLIFQLLRNKQVRLGLDPISSFVAMICEAQGCYIVYSEKFHFPTVYLIHP